MFLGCFCFCFNKKLKEFVRLLPDPVFSFALFDKFVAVGGAMDVDEAVDLILLLPPAHVATVKTVLPLLHEVVCNKDNQMSAQDVALALGPVLLRPAEVSGAKGYPGVAVTCLEAFIANWSKVAETLSVKERRDESEETPTDGGDHIGLFAFLDELGLLHRYDTFKQLGLTMYDLQRMEIPEFLELGIEAGEAGELFTRSRSLPPSPPKPALNSQDALSEDVWADGDLDPRVKRFLVGLGLEQLVGLFEECLIDWVILDMSAVSDFKELGLDDATVVKIMNGLGKDVAVSSVAVPRAIGVNGDALEVHSTLSEELKLDAKWILDLRSIRVQKKIGIGGYAEVWKALFKEKVVAFKLLQEDTTDDKRVVDEFRREMAVMSTLDHPNIVAFYGAVDHGKSLAMVLEYAARGDLEGL
jgi:hypothetical protein